MRLSERKAERLDYLGRRLLSFLEARAAVVVPNLLLKKGSDYFWTPDYKEKEMSSKQCF